MRQLIMVCVLLVAAAGARGEKIVVEQLVDKPDAWFATEEGARIVGNIITWQNPWGGWLKSYDASIQRPDKLPEPELPKGVPSGDAANWNTVSTFDNSATFSELRVLARAVRVTHAPAGKDAFAKGLAFVFESQYANGGWPQRYPIHDNYGRHITFNDNAMVSVLRLLKDISSGTGDFSFVDADTRAKCTAAFNKGIDCILNCQIKVDGKPTVWCQQHDAETLAPTGARTYELPSLSSFESVYITELLMSLENPDDRVKAAVEGAVAWFEASKIIGKKYEKITDAKLEFGVDRRLTDDPSAGPIWARFYDLDTHEPFFCDRDGVKRSSLDQIGAERRARYAWYTPNGQRVLKEYPKWKARVGS